MKLDTVELQKVFESFGPWIELQMAESGIPAFIVSAHTDEGPVFNKVYSQNENPAGPLPDQAPLVPVGSISKIIAVAAVLKLAEQGRLKLDTPFLNFFPDWCVPQGSPLRRVTLLNLARHQSPIGPIPRNRRYPHPGEYTQLAARPRLMPGGNKPSSGPKPGSAASPPTEDRFLRFLRSLKNNDPGMGFEKVAYSSSGIALLGLVVERVSGESYPDFVTKNLLRCNGIRDIFPAMSAMSAADKARIINGNFFDKKAGQNVQVLPVDQNVMNATRGCIASGPAIAEFLHKLIAGKILSLRYTKIMLEDRVPFGAAGYGVFYSPGLTHAPISEKDRTKNRSIGHSGVAADCITNVSHFKPLGLTLCVTSTILGLPPMAPYNFNAMAAPHHFTSSIFQKIHGLMQEAADNSGFERLLSRAQFAPPIRHVFIPPGFNPERAPK